MLNLYTNLKAGKLSNGTPTGSCAEKNTESHTVISPLKRVETADAQTARLCRDVARLTPSFAVRYVAQRDRPILHENSSMNRHQRRARGRQQSPKEPEGSPPPVAAAVDYPPNQPIPKPTLITRLLASVLLSRWILARVQHPDVERLLINFALEAGRHDVADELSRRQTLRGQNHTPPKR